LKRLAPILVPIQRKVKKFFRQCQASTLRVRVGKAVAKQYENDFIRDSSGLEHLSRLILTSAKIMPLCRAFVHFARLWSPGDWVI
jgi:hypothetical protein